jgi:hypothetical protein
MMSEGYLRVVGVDDMVMLVFSYLTIQSVNGHYHTIPLTKKTGHFQPPYRPRMIYFNCII